MINIVDLDATALLSMANLLVAQFLFQNQKFLQWTYLFLLIPNHFYIFSSDELKSKADENKLFSLPYSSLLQEFQFMLYLLIFPFILTSVRIIRIRFFHQGFYNLSTFPDFNFIFFLWTFNISIGSRLKINSTILSNFWTKGER